MLILRSMLCHIWVSKYRDVSKFFLDYVEQKTRLYLTRASTSFPTKGRSGKIGIKFLSLDLLQNFPKMRDALRRLYP